nr:hypothetical protein [Chloroflexota bacterium]
REALRMAEELGLDDLVPHALIDIGLCRHGLGDLAGGVADLERAMALAVAANNVVAARAYNNLAAVTAEDGDTVRATELWREGLRVAERLGNLTVKRFIEGQLFWLDWDAGRWDEALAGAEAFIAACEAGSPHFLHPSALWMRAVIELARESAEKAAIDAHRAVELARSVDDRDQLVPSLALAARTDVELDRVGEAAEHIRETLPMFSEWGAPRPLYVTLVAERIGIAGEVRAALEGARDSTFVKVARRIATGDLVAAADELEELGNLPDAADVRLLAARRLVSAGRRAEADEQLQRALAFYRSVGATRYIREAESLLAATA